MSVCYFSLNSLIQEETFNKICSDKKKQTHTHFRQIGYIHVNDVYFLNTHGKKQFEQTVPLLLVKYFFLLSVRMCA